MTNDVLTRAATVAPSTVNEAERTVEVVWSTGAPVRRRDMEGPFIERLSLDPAHVDLSRLKGASVLDAHRQAEIRNVLGVVLDARADGQQGIGTLRFSKRADVEPIWEDVKAGILRHVSVGYRVEAWREDKDPKTGERTKTAIRWTPIEVSFVPTPADPGATVRSDQAEGDPMSDKPKAPAAAPTPDTNTDPADKSTRAEVNRQIRGIAKVAGLDASFADELIDRGASVEEARAAAFAELEKRGGANIRTEATRVEVGEDHTDPANIRAAMADALAARLAPGLVKPEGRAREFMSYRALDMAGELAFARGDRFNRFNQDELLRRALGPHTTSDFPLLLADAGNKILMAQYQAASPTYRRWAARRSFNDFKAHKFLRVGDFPGYQKIAEQGEVRYGTMSENREQVTADEYATGIIIGRKALINDDLSALSDFSQMIAIRTAADENALAYQVLADNAALSDGVALFHADHGNLAASGSDISVTSIASARAAMRKQTSLDGLKLNIEGSILVVGPDKELKARQVVADITPAKSGDVNPWSGRLTVEVDANITGNTWYLFADPAMYPVVVYGYVNGAEGPQIRTETDFDTQAVKVRSGLDFGLGAIDYRGAYKNPGA